MSAREDMQRYLARAMMGDAEAIKKLDVMVRKNYAQLTWPETIVYLTLVSFRAQKRVIDVFQIGSHLKSLGLLDCVGGPAGLCDMLEAA